MFIIIQPINQCRNVLVFQFRFRRFLSNIWLDYLNMELTHPEGKHMTFGHLHWRAVKDLDAFLVDCFTQQFALLSAIPVPFADQQNSSQLTDL